MGTDETRVVADWYEDRRLQLMAKAVRGDRVVDLGYAHMPNRYLRKSGIHVTGIDLLEPTGLSGYDEEIRADVTAMSTDERFTTALAGELVEHLESPYEFLRAVRKILIPGGRLVLSTPNPLGIPMLFFELTQSRRRFNAADHKYTLTPRWVTRMIESCGFEMEKLVPVGLWNPWLPVPFCPVTLSYQVIYVAKAARRR